MDTNKILIGHILDRIKDTPDESIDMCITSPPYWGLRDYGTKEQIWGDGWVGELGLEPTFNLFVEHLVQIFEAIKPKLTNMGTLWVNLGDTYYGGGNAQGHTTETKQFNQKTSTIETGKVQSPVARGKLNNIKAKSLIGIPDRFKIAMIDNNSSDIFTIDKGFINSEVFLITDNHAIQRYREEESIRQRIPKKVEKKEQGTIQTKNERMERGKSRQDKSLFEKTLLGEQGKGNNTSDERKRKETQTPQDDGSYSLWRGDTDLCVLRGISFAIFNNRSYRWRWEQTPQENKELWFNLSMDEIKELPKGIQSIMHELQLRDGKVQGLSSHGRWNFKIRRRGIPTKIDRFFKLLKEERWLCRNEIIWHKPSCMPSSATDRFTVDFEKLFFFSKNKKYYFKQQFDPIKEESVKRLKRGVSPQNKLHKDNTQTGLQPHTVHNERKNDPNRETPNTRNKRTVWSINPKGFKEAHFAVFPEELIKIPIDAGCPEKVCIGCGKPQEIKYSIVDRIDTRPAKDTGKGKSGTYADPNRGLHNSDLSTKRQKLVYDKANIISCDCNAEFRKGIVLDPFMGSGTTAIVANKQNKDWLGIELNPEYVEIAKKRIAKYGSNQHFDEFF